MNTPLADARVLITGGLGFIGSNLARRCVAEGARVEIYDNLDARAGGARYNVHDIASAITIHEADLLDFDTLATRVAGCDVVFNCAASTSHPRSMREPWFDLDVNCRGTVNLLEALRQHNPGARLVHVGTSTQLGPLQYEPADERHPEFPTDIYSANKSASEKYVLVYARAYQLAATVIRLSNVFGPRATIRSPEFTFNNYFVGLALQDRDITVWGDGAQLRNVVYVDDAVAALVAAAQSAAGVGETFFAVGDHHHSVAEIARETVRVIGRGRVVHVPWPAERQAVDIGRAVLTNRKIRDRFGWAPVVGLAEGLGRTREYFTGCLPEYL